jgi:hypothetical protein
LIALDEETVIVGLIPCITGTTIPILSRLAKMFQYSRFIQSVEVKFQIGQLFSSIFEKNLGLYFLDGRVRAHFLVLDNDLVKIGKVIHYRFSVDHFI